MKKLFILLAPFAFAAVVTTSLFAATASAPAIGTQTFLRNDQSLISFELTSGSSNSRIEIRDENGRTVTTRAFSTSSLNIPTVSLQPGRYSYSIVNGRKASQGTFFVK